MTPPGGEQRFRSIAVLNRGEAAARFLTAAAGWRSLRGVELRTVLFHTEGDRDTRAVWQADQAVSLGADGPPSPYMAPELLLEALAANDVEAVWLGWGFLSESAEFVAALEQRGHVVLAPPSRVIAELGDKVRARALAGSLGIPTVAGSVDPVADVEAALLAGARVGYPVMLKSAMGGGGRGIRMARTDDELRAAFDAAGREAGAGSDGAAVFVERLISGARHIEVQIAADEHGAVSVLGLRDCSVQRMRQKVVEETAILDGDLGARLAEQARALCASVGYVGVGTVEFLVEPSGAHLFLEVNPRLQVEHPVTEATAGVDLVKLQLDIAAGLAVGPDPEHRGHAIEVRLNAEDPQLGFVPSSGRIVTWRPPQAPGVRVDSGFTAGSVVSPHYDSMVAKIIAWGSDRDDAIARLRGALGECRLQLESGTSNRALLRAIVDSEDFVSGAVDTAWLDRRLAALGQPDEETRRWSLLVAAVEVAERHLVDDEQRFDVAARRGRPPLDLGGPHRFTMTHDGATAEVTAVALGPRTFRIDDIEVETGVTHDGRRMVSVGGRSFLADMLWAADKILVESDLGVVRCELDSPGRVRAHGAGMVAALLVAPGATVRRGDPLAIVEAMKMETPVTAPVDGLVRSVDVAVGQRVTAGTQIAVVDGGDPAAEAAEPPRWWSELPAAQGPESWTARRLGEQTVRYVAGFDVAPADERPIVDLWRREGVPSPQTVAEGLQVLEVALDVLALAGRTPQWEAGERPAFESLRLMLRLEPSSWPSLPKGFLDRVRRVAARCGDDEDAVGIGSLYRIWRAVTLRARALAVTDAVLTSWVREPPSIFDGHREVPRLLAELALAVQEESPRTADLADLQRERMRAARRHGSPAAGRLPHAIRRLPEDVRAHGSEIVRLLYGSADVVAAAAGALRAATADGPEVVVKALIAPSTPAAAAEEVGEWASPERHLELFVADLPGEAAAQVAADAALRSRWAAIRVTGVATNGVAQVQTVSIEADGTVTAAPGAVHPELARRLELWRYRDFDVRRLPSTDDVVLLDATGRGEPADRRIFGLAVSGRLADPADGPVDQAEHLEEALVAIAGEMRSGLSTFPASERPSWNRIVLYVDGPWRLTEDDVREVVREVAPSMRGLDLQKLLLRVVPADGHAPSLIINVAAPGRQGVGVGRSLPSPEPVRLLTPYGLRAARLHARGLRDPYEVLVLLTAPGAGSTDFPAGDFREWDLDREGDLQEVERPAGMNTAGVVVGTIRNYTPEHPEGMRRVFVASDPSKRLGALAEPECRRLLATLDLAERLDCPLEWFTVSAGARVAMDSGTENMDWIARVLRRIVRFTEGGGEINVVVAGVNVGAQPYFNAEATMLMHTRGILVMTPGSSMVLTGKEALEAAGGVSGQDNVEIGGYSGVMGPNGQAQFSASSLGAACQILFNWYGLTYVAAGESHPRDTVTSDPVDRDVSESPLTPVEGGLGGTVARIFSAEHNLERKSPFSIRSVIGAVVDRDQPQLERWVDFGEGAVTVEARIGGMSACVIGIESHNLPRPDAPADAPPVWSAGSLFPRGSKKVARAINSASGRRPVVVLANLAGFDGSPASLRELQLEYGAEIGRAVVNCASRIVFCVITRYHGGAFVVFSKQLNDRMTVLALTGAKASVIGGTPAAAVVLAGEVRRRADAEVRELQIEHRHRDALDRARREAHQRHLGAVAREFDAIHSIDRAVSVGSVDEVVAPAELRSRIAALLRADRDRGRQA